MTQPTYDLLNFRFFSDDNTGESDQTALGTGNNQTLDRATGTSNRFCVRIELYNDNNKSGIESWTWEYSYDSGAWTPITTSSSVVRAYDSSLLTDGDDCTQRLSSSTPFLTVNEGVDETGNIPGVSVGAADYLENLLSCYIIATDVLDNKTIDIRVVEDSGDTITYTNTPNLTVDQPPQDYYSGAELDGVGNIIATPYAPIGYNQAHFRIRAGDTVGLNVDDNWAADLDINATVDTGKVFRVRFEVEENAGAGSSKAFKMQYSLNSGTWTDIAYQTSGTSGTTTAIVTVFSSQFVDGAATTNLLSGSSETFEAGEGKEDSTDTSAITLNNEHTEYEWALMIMNFYDGPSQIADNDEIELRIVETNDTVLDNYFKTPTITVNVSEYYIGSCFTEAPNRMGPHCDTNGNLYVILEPADSDPRIMIIKSTDGGKTWAEIDGSNRPTTEDLEACDSVLVSGGTIHFGHMNSANNILYHKFRTSDHGTSPDTWELTDEVVYSGASATIQSVALEVLSNGDVWYFYRRTNASYEEIFYKRRNGTWGSELSLDNQATTNFSFVACVLGDNDLLHIVYQDATNWNVYHKSLSEGGTLSDRDTLTTAARGRECIVMPPVYWDDGGNEMIMCTYLRDTEYLASRVITNDGTPASEETATDSTVQFDQGSSEQPVANIVVDGDTVYLHYANQTDDDLYRARNENDGGWGTDVEEIDDLSLDWIRGTVFTHSLSNGSATVVGYVYDNGSDGATGFIWYDEYIIPKSGAQLDGVGNITATCTVVAGGTFSGAELDGIGTLDVKAGLALTSTTALNGEGTLDVKAGLALTSTTALDGVGTLITIAGVAKKSVAQLDGVGTLDAIAELTNSGKAQLDGVGTLTTTAILQQGAKTALPGVGLLTASASVTKKSRAELDGAGDIAITSQLTLGAQTSFTGTGNLSTVAEITFNAQTQLNGVGSIVAVASLEGQVLSGAELDGVGNITSVANLSQQAQTQLDGVGNITTAAGVSKLGRSELDGTGDVTTSGQLAIGAKVLLLGISQLTIIAKADYAARAQLDGIGSITAAGSLEGQVQSGAQLDGVGNVVADAKADYSGIAALSGEGTLVIAAQLSKSSGVQLDGKGTLAADALMVRGGTATFAGVGDITAFPTVTGGVSLNSGAELDGTGDLVISASVNRKGIIALSGEGTLAIVASATYGGIAQFDGVGNIVASGTLEGEIKSGTELDGVGQIIAVAELAMQSKAEFGGVGSITVTASIQHGAQTQQDGVGTLTASGTSGAVVNSGTSLDGVGSTTTTAQMAFNADTSLDGIGNVTAAAVMSYAGIVSLDGAGAILAAGSAIYLTGAILAGVGDIIARSTISLAYEGLIPVTSVSRELALDVILRDADLDVESR